MPEPIADAFGAILQFLGVVLSGIYDLIPSYGIAIIVLTLLVRVVLIPLTVKQAGDKQMIGRRKISEQQMAMQRQQTLL